MSIKKTKIVFDFDSDVLKDLRKILFSKGVSPQQFLHYMSELVTLKDPRVMTLLEEASEKSKDIKKRENIVDADTIYDLIQSEIDKKKEL